MSEVITRNNEFEQKLPIERERKFLSIFPEQLQRFREMAQPIEQFYLSHPEEPFSLRFREKIAHDGSITYFATLKDRGTIIDTALERLEVEVEVPENLYAYYKSTNAPLLRKLRAEPVNNVVIDFMEDGRILCESENQQSWDEFTAIHGDAFMEVTGDRYADNEWQAHFGYRKQHHGHDTLLPAPDLDPHQVVRDIIAAQTNKSPVVIRLFGRSGSGKSTVVRTIQEQLRSYNVSSEVISTDDYHRGTTWLVEYNNGKQWTEWDHPVVYDTALMAENIQKLLDGEAIARRGIDFSIAEPVYTGSIAPTPVLIIEGIYARSPELSQFESLDYEIPTPVATSIGRRLVRDMGERPEFADPQKSLLYMLEQTEPMWRNQLSRASA